MKTNIGSATVSRGRVVAIAVVAIVGAAIGFGVRALADGPPKMQPLLYSGTMLESGMPVTGTRDIIVSLWDAGTGGTERCRTSTSNVSVTSGRFRVSLSPECTAVVRANPELWSEVAVGSTVLPRRKLGAVPYAIEAEQAATAVTANASATATGALETRLKAIEAAASATNTRLAAVESGPGRLVASGEMAANSSELGWTLASPAADVSMWRSFRKRVGFGTTLPQPPTVRIALRAVDGTSPVRVQLTAESVDTTGFTMAASTWGNSVLFGVEATWLAFSPP